MEIQTSNSTRYFVHAVLGLCTIVIGLQGAIKEQDIIFLIIAVILGIFIGELGDCDHKVNHFVENILSKMGVYNKLCK